MSLFVESVPVLVIVSLDALGFYACPWPAKSSLGRQSSPAATTVHLLFSLHSKHRVAALGKAGPCFINALQVPGAEGLLT